MSTQTTLSADNCPSRLFFSGRWDPFHLWAASHSSQAWGFCSVVLEVVQVNRNSGSLAGLFEGNDLELFDDKRLLMGVDVNRGCTRVSTGNAELVEEATGSRGGCSSRQLSKQWVVFLCTSNNTPVWTITLSFLPSSTHSLIILATFIVRSVSGETIYLFLRFSKSIFSFRM